tara:strand:- start:135 stop:1340 length:1206 start_codon:yes stop_codon:yes gene_type:complete
MKSLLTILLSISVLCTSLSGLELNPERLEFSKVVFSIPYSELSGTSDIFSEGIILNDGDVMEILNYKSSHLELRQYNGYYYDDGGFITVYTQDTDATNYERAVFHNTNPSVVSVTTELIGSYIVGPTTVYVGTQHSGGYPWFSGLSSIISMTMHYAIQRNVQVPDISNYYTKDEVDNLIESNLTNAISLGQQDVTGNPSQYNLFTSSDLSDAQTSSRTAGQQDVISSPSDYELMGAEGVFDMRVSQPGISTNGDKASMNFTIQSSNDLENWNNEETLRREYSMPSDKNFMRVSVGPGMEPESLPAIATDTYGDKLVYDESNNLYVNDEGTPLFRNGVNLRTNTYPGWNFYAIESTSSGYLCLLKRTNQNVIMTFGQDGNCLSVSTITDLSAYESDFGQSLD